MSQIKRTGFGHERRTPSSPVCDSHEVIRLTPHQVSSTYDIELEARIFTPEEFEEMLRSFSLTALDALEEGVVLYDDGFWRKMQAIFESMERDGLVKRIDGGWKVMISDAPSKRARACRC